MILQGTDALSRGIWISPFQGLMDPARITQAVFDPLAYDPELAQYYVNLLPELHHADRKWCYCNWRKPWDAAFTFDKLTVWFPPPEIARQALSFLLENWTERPLTTSGLFFIPRTSAVMWRGIFPAFGGAAYAQSSPDSAALPTNSANPSHCLVLATSPAFSSHTR